MVLANQNPDLNYYLDRERINQLLSPDNYNLITLTADTGYGKTLSLTNYLMGKDIQIVWITLTLSDNYVLHFWNRFTKALKTIDSESSFDFDRLVFPTDHYLMYEFFQRMHLADNKQEPFIIVFDDFHILNNASVQSFILSLPNFALENMCVYILSRTEINLFGKKSTLQYKNITTKDLGFTIEEITEYFLQNEIQLPYETIFDINLRTKGWPIVVYLIFVTIKNNRDAFLKYTEISDSLIFDTIQQEIFSKYTLEEKKFILRLSLFENYSAQLLEDLFQTELKKFQHILTKTVFIRYNRHADAFQFHQLFQDFLFTQRHLLAEEEITEIYRSVANWHEQRGLMVEALQYYRKIKDYESLWRIIFGFMPDYFSPELAETIIECIHEFPESFKNANPLADVVAAATYVMTGKLKMIRYISLEAIGKLEKAPPTTENLVALGHAYTELAFYYMMTGNIKFAEYFKKAYEYSPEGNPVYKKPFLFLLNDSPITLTSGEPGALDQWVTSLMEAEPYLSKLLFHHMDGLPTLAKATACYLQGDMAKGIVYAIRGMQQAQENKQVDLVCQAYYILMKIYIYKGDYEKTFSALEEMKQYAEEYNTNPRFYLPELAQSFLHLQLKNLDKISDWITYEKKYSMKTFTHHMGFERLIKAGALLVEGENTMLIPYLEHTEQIYKIENRCIFIIYVYIYQAIAYYETKDMDKSVQALYKAYEMSWQNNMITLFVMYEQKMVKLINGLNNTMNNHPEQFGAAALEQLDHMQQWLRKVYTKASSYAKRINIMQEIYRSKHPEAQNKKQILTERERKILRDISEGLTREEIIDSMGISMNTLKSSLTYIYSKLGAANGFHAIRIAILRGLI